MKRVAKVAKIEIDAKGVEHHLDDEGNEFAIRVPVFCMDSMNPEQRRIAEIASKAFAEDAALKEYCNSPHRPGYRGEQTAESVAAYDAAEQALGEAWKAGDKPVTPVVNDSQPGVSGTRAFAAALADAVPPPSNMDRIYAEHDQALRNAWKIAS